MNINPCNPNSNIQNVQSRARTNLGVPKSLAARLNKNNLCNAYKKCGKNASSLPPMKLSKTKTHVYLIDRNSPITAREFEIVLGKGKLSELRKIANKLGFMNTKLDSKSVLKTEITAMLKKLDLTEPVQLPIGAVAKKNKPTPTPTPPPFTPTPPPEPTLSTFTPTPIPSNNNKNNMFKNGFQNMPKNNNNNNNKRNIFGQGAAQTMPTANNNRGRIGGGIFGGNSNTGRRRNVNSGNNRSNNLRGGRVGGGGGGGGGGIFGGIGKGGNNKGGKKVNNNMFKKKATPFNSKKFLNEITTNIENLRNKI